MSYLEDILNKNPELKKKLITAALAFENTNPDTGEVNPNFIYSSESDEEDQDYTTQSESASSSETEDDTIEEDTEHIEKSNIIQSKDSPT